MECTHEQRAAIVSTLIIIAVAGVAGCGKTRTLVERVINQAGSNILIIARTNSVVEEIQSRCQKYNIILKKVNSSNHYTYKAVNGKCISIATIDAFIDCQLRVYKSNSSDDIFKTDYANIKGNDHNGKKKIFEKLCNQGKTTRLYIKNEEGLDIEADQIHIDEVQDMTPIELNQFISILKNNPTLGCSVYGDTLQTLTKESTKMYPIETFINELNATQFNLSTCFRCPLAHILFNNCLLNEVRKTGIFGNLPEMKSNNNNILDKPFLWTHKGMSNGSNAPLIAKHIIDLINAVMCDDPEIKIYNVVLLVTKTNKNESLPIILDEIKKEFNQKFHHFETMIDDDQTSIDFNKLKNQKCNCLIKSGKNKGQPRLFPKGKELCTTCNIKQEIDKGCIISVDGFKGKEAKLVISLNLSEKSIPRENHTGKPIELIDYSKLNVLTTRSLKYYFCGINEELPSQYFMNKKKELDKNKLYYHPWNLKKIKNEKVPKEKKKLQKQHDDLFKDAPNIYKKLAEKFCNNPEPKENQFQKLNTPDNSGKLNVTHISENLDIDDLSKCTKNSCNYGKKCDIDEKYDSRVIGLMGELIIWRELYINNKIENDNSCKEKILTKYSIDQVHQIDPEDIDLYLKIIDLGINKSIIKLSNQNFTEYQDILEDLLGRLSLPKKSKHEYKIHKLIASEKIKIFGLNNFSSIKKDISIFLDKKIPNKHVDSYIYFNITLLLDHIESDIYRPVLINYINTFKEDLVALHYNVCFTVEKLNSCKLETSRNLSYTEKNQAILVDLGFSKEENENIFKNGYPTCIVGRTDIEYKNNLIEIKTSTSDNCKNSWINQCYLYEVLHKMKEHSGYSTIVVNNILTGTEYSIDFKETIVCTKIIEIILDKYNFIPVLKRNCINKYNYSEPRKCKSNSVERSNDNYYCQRV